MKTLLKIFTILLFLSATILGQVVLEKPDAPSPIYFSGGDLTEKQEQEYLSKIKNEDLKKELLEIKKTDKKKYYRLLSKISFMSLPSIYSFSGDSDYRIFGEEKTDELRNKITELELYTEVLGVKYQEANQAEKQKIAIELKNKLNDVFDLRESQRKEEVDKLEKKLAELKESIKIRNDNKQQIVEERFRTLTGKGKYLKWD